MAAPQGRRLGYHTPEQVSNQEPPYSRPGVFTTALLGVCATGRNKARLLRPGLLRLARLLRVARVLRISQIIAGMRH